MHVYPPQKKSLRIKNNIPISELRDIRNVEFYLGGCPRIGIFAQIEFNEDMSVKDILGQPPKN